MRAAGLATLGIVAYLVFLLATLPASVVAREVASATRGAVQLEELRGTAWNGSARGTVAIAGYATAWDALTWRWRPASLAAGRFAFDIDATRPQMELRGEVGRSFTGWEARELRLEGNAAALGAMLPLLATWRPEGSVSAQAPAISWTQSTISGEARAEWRNAAVALSQVRPLGTYRAQLQGDGAQGRVTLSTVDGPLKLSGNGALTPQGRLSFAGEARAEGPQAQALQPLLDLLGRRRPDGSRELVLR